MPVEPRVGHVQTPDGRRPAFRDGGDPDATPIVSHHWTPGARLDRHPAGRLPDARFEPIPGAGHALSDHMHEILAWLGGR